MNNKYTTADRFSADFAKLIESSVKGIDAELPKAVRKSCVYGRKEVVNGAKEVEGKVKEWSKEYIGGFSYKVVNRGGELSGTIGNKNKPGLVHLLEKGHAKMGGGRTRVYEHVGPAADKTFIKFIEEVEAAIDRGLQQ